MRRRIILLLGAAACAAVYADDLSDRSKINGAWEVTGGEKEVWVMEQKGDSIKITQSHNDQPLSQLQCKIGGGECQGKDSGHSAKVMMWFNGPKLVEMETRGSEVVKRLFSANGDDMEMQVIPIVPEGKPQVIKLKRTKLAE